MGNGEKVIAKFGGQSALAKLLGKGQSTVQHWSRKGIPAKWQKPLLDLAKANGIDLSPDDFFQDKTAIEVEPKMPKAEFWGELEIGDTILPCYVLDSGERVFSLKGIVSGLIGTEGGQLAEYIKVKSLKPFLSEELTPAENDQIPALFQFDTGGEGFTKFAFGLSVEKFMDLCAAYSSAAESSEVKLTERQKQIAVKANAFLRACAKVGIVALVDEATGYQYERAQDALKFKLNLYLQEEMRKWEKTFPDQLWVEFGRLTKWTGPVTQRPKYWGKLVMELVYGYLDPDVAAWLKTNAPKPISGHNYHQWLSSQYGLKKLTEHLWMLIGMASTCQSMAELRAKVAERFGRVPIQLTLYFPPQ